MTTATWTPERVEAVTGVPAAEARGGGRDPRDGTDARVDLLQGVYQSLQATATAVQVNNLHLIRGMIGKPGSTVFQMNGQPTAQNTRECGANGEFVAFRNWENPEHVAETARVWNVEPSKLPTLDAADARDADLPARRDGLDPLPLDHRHEPGRLAARAAAASARSCRRRTCSSSSRTPS